MKPEGEHNMLRILLRRRLLLLVGIVVTFVISFNFSSCSTPINIFSDSDDINLGQQIDSEIKKDAKQYPILQNRPDVKTYCINITKKILASPAVKKNGVYAYQVEVIKDDSTINAFCTPGGYIYVYTGLLKFVDNEATLAGVLGHEIAHAERRHATQRMTKAYGVQMLLSLVLGENPNQIASIAANLFTGLGLLANSRADETEADEYSFKYLSASEYYPGAIRFFFDKIGAAGTRQGGSFERLLSTHPLPQDRVDHVKEMLAKAGNPPVTESNTIAARYKDFRAKLP
jgi:predicted Zn-dependent protease